MPRLATPDIGTLTDAAIEREGRLVEISLERARLEEKKLLLEQEREKRALMR